MMTECVEPYSAVHVYDGSDVLRTVKEGTHTYDAATREYKAGLFGEVNGITSYRYFMLLADDGKLGLGEGAKLDSIDPVTAAQFKGKGPLFMVIAS
jgi:hypothetical protein